MPYQQILVVGRLGKSKDGGSGGQVRTATLYDADGLAAVQVKSWQIA
jgi:hypothetical protein